jgi:formate dehydrogenase major subunit
MTDVVSVLDPHSSHTKRDDSILLREVSLRTPGESHVEIDFKRGVVFIPFHFAEAAANKITNSAIDPVAKIPEYKVCAVKVEVF